jgi:hypothetical protein
VDPDGRENSSWLSDQEEEDKKALHYSQAPQLIEYVYMEYDYTLFAWYCIISGVILGAIGGILSAPYLLSFAKTLASLAPVIATKIIGAIRTAIDFFRGLPREIKAAIVSFLFKIITWIIETIKEITWIIETIKEMNEPSGAESFPIYNENGEMIGVNTILDEMAGYQRGLVYFFNGPGEEDDTSYEWKYQSGKYYVLMNDEWVEMPEGWKPGDPLPS